MTMTIGGIDLALFPDRVIGEAGEGDHRHPAPLETVHGKAGDALPFDGGGRRHHLGRHDCALPSSPVKSQLLHCHLLLLSALNLIKGLPALLLFFCLLPETQSMIPLVYMQVRPNSFHPETPDEKLLVSKSD
jgi:hypothetical protein